MLNMSLHARKHDVVGCEKQMGKTASQRPSLISAFVIRSLLNSIATVRSEARNFTFVNSPCSWTCWFELDLVNHNWACGVQNIHIIHLKPQFYWTAIPRYDSKFWSKWCGSQHKWQERSTSAKVVVEVYWNLHDRHLMATVLICSKFT